MLTRQCRAVRVLLQDLEIFDDRPSKHLGVNLMPVRVEVPEGIPATESNQARPATTRAGFLDRLDDVYERDPMRLELAAHASDDSRPLLHLRRTDRIGGVETGQREDHRSFAKHVFYVGEKPLEPDS